MAVSGERFAALSNPLNRSVQLACGIEQTDVFRKQENFHPESTAYVITFHENVFWLAAENGASQQSSEKMNPLTGYVEDHPVGVRIDSGYRAPRFHRGGYDSVIHQFEFDGCIRFGERGFGFSLFPAFPMETLIVLGLIPDLWRLCTQTVLSLNCDVQRFIVDPQLVGSIQGLLFGLGNNERYGIA